MCALRKTEYTLRACSLISRSYIITLNYNTQFLLNRAVRGVWPLSGSSHRCKPTSATTRCVLAPPALWEGDRVCICGSRLPKAEKENPNLCASTTRSLRQPELTLPQGPGGGRVASQGCPLGHFNGIALHTAFSCPRALEATDRALLGEEPRFQALPGHGPGRVPVWPGRVLGAAGHDGPARGPPGPQSSVSGWTPRMACSSSGVKPSRFCRSHTKRYT